MDELKSNAQCAAPEPALLPAPVDVVEFARPTKEQEDYVRGISGIATESDLTTIVGGRRRAVA